MPGALLFVPFAEVFEAAIPLELYPSGLQIVAGAGIVNHFIDSPLFGQMVECVLE